MLIITEVQSELAIITKFAKIGKNRKSDDFLCYLPFCTVLCHVNNQSIASLTIFSVTGEFSQFFVMLMITKPDRVADLTKFAKNCQKSPV